MKTLIEDFFKLKTLAVIGASQKKDRFGYSVYSSLKNKNINVYPINIKYSEVAGDLCYPDLMSLPEKADGAIIIVAKKNVENAINDAILTGVKNIWIQQGSESAKAIELAKNNDIKLITNKCVLMFAEPVTGFHKFHRSLKKLFGGLY